MNQQDKAADRRLQRTYGITLADYNQMLKDQNGGCWMCHRPPKENKRLHVDHDHRIARTKIRIERDWFDKTWWRAYAIIGTKTISIAASTKQQAKKDLQQKLKRLSVRGLLCWRDNTALQKFQDNPALMRAGAEYIEKYREKLNN